MELPGGDESGTAELELQSENEDVTAELEMPSETEGGRAEPEHTQPAPHDQIPILHQSRTQGSEELKIYPNNYGWPNGLAGGDLRYYGPIGTGGTTLHNMGLCPGLTLSPTGGGGFHPPSWKSRVTPGSGVRMVPIFFDF